MEGSLGKRLSFILKIFRYAKKDKRFAKLIRNLIKLTETNLLKAMKPKSSIITLNENNLLSFAYEKIRDLNYTKYPVVNDDSEFVGIFYIRDLIRNIDKMNETTIRKLTKPAHYIPYSYSIIDAIEFLREKRVSIALVVDENGMVIGMVTMEDLLEEIVGDIKNEYEFLDIVRISDDEYKISSSISIDEFSEFIKENFSVNIEIEPNSTYATLSGLLLEKLGKVPKVGDTIELDGFVFEILEIDGYKIKTVRMKKI